MDRKTKIQKHMENRINRSIDNFVDYWIVYRTQEPNMPVLRNNQEAFKADLERLVKEFSDLSKT